MDKTSQFPSEKVGVVHEISIFAQIIYYKQIGLSIKLKQYKVNFAYGIY